MSHAPCVKEVKTKLAHTTLRKPEQLEHQLAGAREFGLLHPFILRVQSLDVYNLPVDQDSGAR